MQQLLENEGRRLLDLVLYLVKPIWTVDEFTIGTNDSHNLPCSEVEAEAPTHSWRAIWPRMWRSFAGSHLDPGATHTQPFKPAHPETHGSDC